MSAGHGGPVCFHREENELSVFVDYLCESASQVPVRLRLITQSRTQQISPQMIDTPQRATVQ